ncbi:DUF3492 domain-containing protein, partial [Streptomyces sp. NPDC004262]
MTAVDTGATRVTMLTEGTYPHSHGGVSVWCDQLVQGIPDVDFQILAVTGDGRESRSRPRASATSSPRGRSRS